MLTTKFIVGTIASSSVVISAGAGTYFYLTSNYTINQLLNKENPKKDNLKKSSKNKELWLAKWKAYVTENKENTKLKAKDIWELNNWAVVGAKEDTVPDIFAEKCEEKLNEKVTNSKDPKYTNFIKWCTK